MTAGLMLDIAVIALIALAAVFGFLLNRKLKKLADAQAALHQALETFNGAAAQADGALKRMEQEGVTLGADLRAAAARAQRLATDLSVMTAAGDRVADRIEAALAAVRAAGGARKNQRAA